MLDKTVIIIQARTGSNRLPNKVLLPFYNDLSILDIIINRLKDNKHKLKIIVATTTNIEDNNIEDLAIKNKVLHFRGSENNVLERFIKCAEEYNANYVIRVCADNPFILTDFIDDLIDISCDYKNIDYISFKNDENIPVIKTHLGLFAEFVSLNAIKRVAEQTSDNLFLEHVTNYIYTNENTFNIKLISLPNLLINRNDLRFTCDTIDDFNMLKKLYEEYVSTFKSNNIVIENLLSIVDKNHEYLNVMLKGINEFKK
jgi:spore coat polysaccharide biosynthesis protein SpsF